MTDRKRGSKVWGGTMMRGGRQYRVIFKGPQKHFLKLTKISRDYISETGNVRELAAADARPFTLLGCPLDDHKALYRKVKR